MHGKCSVWIFQCEFQCEFHNSDDSAAELAAKVWKALQEKPFEPGIVRTSNCSKLLNQKFPKCNLSESKKFNGIQRRSTRRSTSVTSGILVETFYELPLWISNFEFHSIRKFRLQNLQDLKFRWIIAPRTSWRELYANVLIQFRVITFSAATLGDDQ